MENILEKRRRGELPSSIIVIYYVLLYHAHVENIPYFKNKLGIIVEHTYKVTLNGENASACKKRLFSVVVVMTFWHYERSNASFMR